MALREGPEKTTGHSPSDLLKQAVALESDLQGTIRRADCLLVLLVPRSKSA